MRSFTRRGFLGLLGGAAAVRFTPAPGTPAEALAPTWGVDLATGPDKTAMMLGGDALTVEHLLAAVETLRSANVPAFEGAYYVHFHPDTLMQPDVRALLDGDGFRQADWKEE